MAPKPWAGDPPSALAPEPQHPTYDEDVQSRLTIIFEPAEEGGFTAYIPEVPGAVSEGDTIEEAREMVMDALRELLASRRERALGEAS